MTGYLRTYDGRRFELPRALSWRFQYGAGTPCDSFRVECPWGLEVDKALSDAVEFEAEEGGETVFRGRVDEYECAWDGRGGRLLAAGRGMCALLLDNEAMPADYQTATLEDILRDHVTPYGIQVAEKSAVGACPGFSVESGCSEWQVLCDFAKHHGALVPRFDREGRLLLTPWKDGRSLVLDDGTALTECTYRERRYGLLSEVLVRDRGNRTLQRVAAQEQIDRGVRCARVVTMPGRSGTGAVRSGAQYQLEQSLKERLRLEVRCGGAFLAWPGDLVELRRTRPRLGGIWRVREVETGVDEDGEYTVLVMGEK